MQRLATALPAPLVPVLRLVVRAPRWLRVLVTVAWMGVIWLASARGAQAIQSDAAAGVRSAPGPLLHIAAIAGHVIEFGILGALLNWALPVRRNWLRRGAAWALASAYGGVDEWHQSWVPGRYPSVEDVAVDSVSGLAGAFASDLLLDVAQAAVSAAADPIPPASERE